MGRCSSRSFPLPGGEGETPAEELRPGQSRADTRRDGTHRPGRLRALSPGPPLQEAQQQPDGGPRGEAQGVGQAPALHQRVAVRDVPAQQRLQLGGQALR